MTHEEKEIKIKFERPLLIVLITALALLVFSIVAPYLFTRYSGIDFSDKGEIGDTIGGVTAPFIAASGVLLTFIAFYVQYQANTQQREQFKKQLAEDKRQFQEELTEQRNSTQLAQFENQFYEMLRLHKENVNEIQLTIRTRESHYGSPINHEQKLSGRAAFNYFMYEIEILYSLAKIYLPKSLESENHRLSMAYSLFFHGLKPKEYYKGHEYQDFYYKVLDLKVSLEAYNEYTNRRIFELCAIDYIDCLHSEFLKGTNSELAHYYRHLFHTVKFVADQNEKFINYTQKRSYLRILRAQLSNQEQTMLFYNWLSGFGKQWNNDDHHYLTDYRMIHNIYPELLIPDFDLYQIFKLEEPTYYRVLQNKKVDLLFEFQEPTVAGSQNL